MKRKRSPERMPLSGFAYPAAQTWEESPDTVKPSAAKVPISIRLSPEQIDAARKAAATKSVGYQTQLRMWIAEGIRREGERT